MGRTGKLFACEGADIQPDVMALAKGLGGGLPIGAILATEKAAGGMVPGIHGTTFGGNPLAMAVANAVLDVMFAPDFLPRVQRRRKLMRPKLAGLAPRFPHLMDEVPGTGLMLGQIRSVVRRSRVSTSRENSGW